MKIAVLVKYIPAPSGVPELGSDNLVIRQGVDGGIDPGDEVGVEAALQLAEAAGDAEVVAVTMGPDEASAAITRALAMGASSGVHVSDPALRGADAWVTANVLAATLRRIQPDLVIAAIESSDAYTGTMPITVAGLMNLPSVTFARRLDITGGELRGERQTESGYDVVVSSLPAVATVVTMAYQPRYPSIKGIMQAKSKPVERLTLADLDFGDAGSPSPLQSVSAVGDVPAKSAGKVVEASGDEAARLIADALAEAKVI